MSRILLIDSDQSTVELLQSTLTASGYEVQAATTGNAGLAASLEKVPSLVLLANSLPDQAGLEVFQVLRSRARTMHIPVIMLAQRNEAGRQNEILKAGADDFIVKPFDIDILTLRIRNTIMRSERDGLHHPQTGLATGRLIQERVRALADEYGWYKIDFEIDGFSGFRESYGFMTGQEVLNFAATLINEVVQASGTPDDFTGQRGDAQFMIITRRANGAAVREAIERRFNEGVQSFYNFMDRDQGYLEIDDGSGGKVRHPLMHARIKILEGEED